MAKDKTTKVRILADTDVNGEALKVNAVVVLDAAVAKSLIASGLADDTAAAVAYAESLTL